MKLRKKRFIASVIMFGLCMAVVGCGGGSSTAKNGEEQKTDKGSAGDYKIVLLLPGQINDQSWNATNYAGLQACNEQLGTKMEYVENVQAADFESTFREYAERGYDLVLAAGSQFDEAVATIAPNYPDTTFCVVNGLEANGDNIAPIFPREYEASYLAAIIAGNITETGHFATIGGFPNKPMEHLMDVYEKTSISIAEDRGIKNAKATRAYANNWSDIAQGKQMTEQMIDNGADVIFAYANEIGLGCIDAAKEKGVKFVGFSSDQTTVDPNTVVASVVFDFETFYTWAIQQYMDGKLVGNVIHEAGIAEDIFKVVYTDNITSDIKDSVENAVKEYKEGKKDLNKLFEDNQVSSEVDTAE